MRDIGLPTSSKKNGKADRLNGVEKIVLSSTSHETPELGRSSEVMGG